MRNSKIQLKATYQEYLEVSKSREKWLISFIMSFVVFLIFALINVDPATAFLSTIGIINSGVIMYH